MKLLTRAVVALLFCCCGLYLHAQSVPGDVSNGRNVVVVMTDGLRWQEVFRGADPALVTPKRYYDGRSTDSLAQKYLAPTPEGRRALLFPFLWKTLIPEGTIYGDLDVGSDAHVTNGFNFSYPGYSETLTGHPDPRIHSNDNIPNPNRTVLEWLNAQPGLEGRVAAFAAWEVISGVINPQRSHVVTNVSYDPLLLTPSTPAIDLLNQVKAGAPRIWDDEVFDAPTFLTAMEYVKLKKPRVLYISLGETDDWAHGGNYGEYLESAHRVDGYLKTLWSTLNAMPEYRNNTTLILLTDHGRGDGPETWQSHGEKLPESKQIFIAMMGAGVPASGVQTKQAPVTQSQVAATVARALGLDYNKAEPQAGAPLPLR